MGQMRHSPPAKSHFRLYIDILCLNYVTVWYKHRRKISIKTKQYTVYHPEATATNAKATIQKKKHRSKSKLISRLSMSPVDDRSVVGAFW